METEPLFSRYDAHASVRNSPGQLKEAVENLGDKQLFEVDQNKVIEDLVAQHRADIPTLDVDAVTAAQQEISVDVSGDHRRFFDKASSGPHYIKATEIAFRVPFKGDREMFLCKPTKRTIPPPRADIEGGAIVIRIVREDHKPEEYRKQFDRTITEINQGLDQLRVDFAGLEETLRQTAITELKKRREKREKDRSLIDQLGLGKPKAG